MSPALTTFVFETINFVLLVLALGWMFVRPMRKLLDDELAARAKSDAERTDAAAALSAQQAELSARLLGIEEEAKRARDRARRDGEAEAARALANAERRADEERVRLSRELDARRKNEIEALSREVGRLTERMVLDVFAVDSGIDADVAFARAASASLSRIGSRAGGSMLVECAHPPSAELRATLRAALGASLDRAELRVVPELVAGVRVASDVGLVDASALGLARHAERALGSPEITRS